MLSQSEYSRHTFELICVSVVAEDSSYSKPKYSLFISPVLFITFQVNVFMCK